MSKSPDNPNTPTPNSGMSFALSICEIGGEALQTVSARNLHEAMNVGKDFSTWMKDRIEQYGFSENRDFVLLPNSGEYSRRGQPAKEYAITLDMAKELAMVERSPEGKAARTYFIECERRLKAAIADPAKVLSDPAALRSLLLESTEKRIELEGIVEMMRPQVQALERIALSDGSLCVTDAAKTLGVRPKVLFARLRENHWVFTRQGDGTLIAYQAKLQVGYLEHKTTIVTRTDGSEKTTTQVRITAKGLAKLAETFPPNPPAAMALAA